MAGTGPLVNSAGRDPRNVTRDECQQAERAEKHPAALEEMAQDCWAIPDTRRSGYEQGAASQDFLNIS